MTDNTMQKTLTPHATAQGTAQRSMQDRLRGCLLAGAVGDALGAPVEFMRWPDIIRRFGPQGIADYAPCYGRIGAITDDTQMTLFTAEGMLRAYVRGSLRGMCSITSVVSHAYLRWLKTQGITPIPKIDEQSGLFRIPDLHTPRAPGNTCLSALQAMPFFTDQRAANDSKGAGGIMRVAPVAMMFHGQPEEASSVFRLGKESAWITHGHPCGYYAAAAFAVILHALLSDESMNTGIERADKMLQVSPQGEETRNSLLLAVELAEKQHPAHLAIPRIGEAWVGEEALGIAVYCALVANDLEHGIRLSVNHGGDSDTTGTLVGQLLGAQHGVSAIPERWLSPLELRDEIIGIADDLYHHREWNLDETDYDEEIVARYPGR